MTYPNINTEEKDFTRQSKRVDQGTVAYGFAFTAKGDALTPIIVNSGDDFAKTFGDANIDNYVDHRNIINFFKEAENGTRTYINRLIHNQLPLSGASGTGYAYSNGSQNAGIGFDNAGVYGSSIDLLFLNENDYIKQKNAGLSYGGTEIIRFYAKDPGSWGNSLQIGVVKEADRKTQAYINGTTSYYSEIFRYALGTNEIGILVMDSSNNILEKFVCSLASGETNIYGENTYVEDYLLKYSKYIRAFKNSANSNMIVSTYVRYLSDGESAPACHTQSTDNATYKINGQTDAGNLIYKMIDSLKNVEEYPIDVLIDSGFVSDGNMILNVDTDATTTADLVIDHDTTITNLYVAEVSADTVLMDLGERIVLQTGAAAFIGYGKCLAKYGYESGGTTHFVVFETNETVAGTDVIKFNGGVTTVTVSTIASINAYRNLHDKHQERASLAIASAKSIFYPMVNPVSKDIVTSSPTETEYKNQALAYFGSIGVSGTADVASYSSFYFNAMYDYVPELDLWSWIPMGGAIAGRFVKNDKVEAGPFFATAGKRGDLKATKIWYSPLEETRVELNESNINTVYYDGSIVKIDGNRTMYTPNSYKRSIDIRRTLIYMKKILFEVALRIQFDLNLSTKRERFVNKSIVKLDFIKNNDGIIDYRVIDDTTVEDENQDIGKWLIWVKPLKTNEFVKLVISLDDDTVNYDELI